MNRSIWPSTDGNHSGLDPFYVLADPIPGSGSPAVADHGGYPGHSPRGPMNEAWRMPGRLDRTLRQGAAGGEGRLMMAEVEAWSVRTIAWIPPRSADLAQWPGNANGDKGGLGERPGCLAESGLGRTEYTSTRAGWPCSGDGHQPERSNAVPPTGPGGCSCEYRPEFGRPLDHWNGDDYGEQLRRGTDPAGVGSNDRSIKQDFPEWPACESCRPFFYTRDLELRQMRQKNTLIIHIEPTRVWPGMQKMVAGLSHLHLLFLAFEILKMNSLKNSTLC